MFFPAGKRAYPCNECNKAFKSSGARNRHQKDVHDDKKVYFCAACAHNGTEYGTSQRTNMKASGEEGGGEEGRGMVGSRREREGRCISVHSGRAMVRSMGRHRELI